ncbi:MAG: transcription initiation factor IIB [Candidatus Lokiarchaeota archaeon]|nr:transcription initiation factor IIB [Candidatus Lokiarchaeota archaeon]MBD3198716.1 transcription initiation factor IIB [Candidatus Lokiarchaeota archaeon]
MDVKSDVHILSNSCPECNGKVIPIEEKGEIVCCQCGLVINERILDIAHSGKRAFTKQEKAKRERTGSPISILLPDMGLSTVIDKSSIKSPDLKRAAKWNSRMTWDKRNMLIATTELKRIASNLNLPSHVKKAAIKLYIRAFKKKLLRGRSINGMVAACLYFCCRERKIPRTLQEILEETSISAKNVRRCYRTLIRELNLKAPCTDPISLIPRFIAELGLDTEAEKITIKILKAYTSNFSISGKDPKGLCAGSLYLVCKVKNKKTSQKEIANLIGVTEVTLRSRYKEIIKKLNIKI